MSDRDAEINRLRLQGYTLAEIGRRVGLTPATVQWSLRRSGTLAPADRCKLRPVSLPKISILERSA